MQSSEEQTVTAEKPAPKIGAVKMLSLPDPHETAEKLPKDEHYTPEIYEALNGCDVKVVALRRGLDKIMRAQVSLVDAPCVRMWCRLEWLE